MFSIIGASKISMGEIIDAVVEMCAGRGPCRKLNQRRLERQFKASLTRAEEYSSVSVARGPLGPLPPRHRAQRSYISFEENNSPIEGTASGPRAKLPLLLVSLLPLPSERADEVEPFATEVASDEVTNSAPRKDMTEDVDQISGTIILKGFPSQLRVLALESDSGRRASGWDLYRKFGDPSTQSGVEDLDVGKETERSEGASIIHHANYHPKPGGEVANEVSVPSHQPKTQRAGATAGLYQFAKATVMAAGSMPGEDTEPSKVLVWALKLCQSHVPFVKSKS